MKRLIPITLLILFGLTLIGCGKDWTHPRISDPQKEDRIFEEDYAKCANTVGDNEAAIEKCLRDKGWETYDDI